MKSLAFFLFIVLPFLTIRSVSAASSAAEIENRLRKLEASVLENEAEIAILKSHTGQLIERATLGFRDAHYFKGGLSLLFPRASSFSFQTDTGIGIQAGVGKYFGENHVIEVSVEWDAYPAVAARYRFELHGSSPQVSFGPLIGARVKIANASPIDSFLSQPSQVKSQFLLLGASVGFPMGRALLNGEIVALMNEQVILVFNASVHFFL